MKNKHSYRALVKRRLAGHILFYLKDPEDAETIFKYGVCKKSEQEIKSAYSFAKILLDFAKKGQVLSTKAYSPYANEIKKILTQYATKQLKLAA